jgi:hypothetical protein
VTSQGFSFRYDPGAGVRVPLWAHIQGVARLSLPGFENWFVLSKHNDKDVHKAGLLLVRWADIPARGDAFRALAPQGRAGVGKRQVRRFGRSHHPGGIQLCGSILAVAQTNPGSPPPWVDFVNLQNPAVPSYLPRLTLDAATLGKGIGNVTSVALTRSATGRYLCFVYRYASRTPGIHQGWLFATDTTFLNANSRWLPVAALFDRTTLPAEWQEAYENLGFVAQRDGTLYLCGFRGSQSRNAIDLFRLEATPIGFRYVLTHDVQTAAAGASFRSGASLFVARSGQLLLYASQQAEGPGGKLDIEEFA